jgi:hypothetical protein
VNGAATVHPRGVRLARAPSCVEHPRALRAEPFRVECTLDDVAADAQCCGDARDRCAGGYEFAELIRIDHSSMLPKRSDGSGERAFA